MKKIECLLLCIAIFYVGNILTSALPGVFNYTDAYVYGLETIRFSILYLCSILSGIGYLIIKELKNK